MDISDKFRKAFSEESDYPLTDELLDYILNHSDILKADKGSPIIDLGETNPDVFIIYEGIVRGYMLVEGVETNLYFGMEGTFVVSMQPFRKGSPSIIRIEACTATTLLRIRKSVFDRMMEESSTFCRWVAGVFIRMSYYTELKGKIMNGDACWRYEWLEKCRPELYDAVPLKAIASYLKMSEVHVSRIRKKILKGIDRKKP